MAFERSERGFVFSDDLARLDLDRVEAFMRQSYWASARTREQLDFSAANSMCFGIYRAEDDVQVAFARAVTDKATFAWLCDVFVDPTQRGNGLGKFLIESILDHPQLRALPRWILATRDAHGLYAQYGFTPLGKPETWMERVVRGTVQSERVDQAPPGPA